MVLLVQTVKYLVEPFWGPKSIVVFMNAGANPAGRWTRNHKEGRGRIIGEACNHIDLIRRLVGDQK